MIKLIKDNNNNSDSIKYYLNCPSIKDTKTWINNLELLETNQERAILKALINDNVIRKNKQIVIKLGIRNTIEKEYNIGNLLYNNVPGFIKYICLTQCSDNLIKYKNINSTTTVCSNDINDPLLYMLVMPYFPYNSIRKIKWNSYIPLLKSCIKQAICSLTVAYINYGFLHGDIHLGNILVKETNKKFINYGEFQVETNGLEIVIMDFEYSFIIKTNKNSTINIFFKDILRVIQDIGDSLNIYFDQTNNIINYIRSKSNDNNSKVTDIFFILPVIDKMTIIDSKAKIPLVYNPNVY